MLTRTIMSIGDRPRGVGRNMKYIILSSHGLTNGLGYTSYDSG